MVTKNQKDQLIISVLPTHKTKKALRDTSLKAFFCFDNQIVTKKLSTIHYQLSTINYLIVTTFFKVVVNVRNSIVYCPFGLPEKSTS